MEQIAFKVQGSASEPYKVVFVRRSPTQLSAYCTCPAGQNSIYCKHRFAILDGVKNGIVSANIDDVAVVQSWLKHTDVERALHKVRTLEKDAAKIKEALSTARAQLANALHD